MLALTTSPGYHKTQTLNCKFYKNVSCGVIVDIKKTKNKKQKQDLGAVFKCAKWGSVIKGSHAIGEYVCAYLIVSFVEVAVSVL